MAQITTILSPSATPTPIPATGTVRTTLMLRNLSTILRTPPLLLSAKTFSGRPLQSPLRANPPQKYIYPDPNPEFAEAETKKFREELVKKLSEEKETLGDDLDAVVNVCTDYGTPLPTVEGTYNELFQSSLLFPMGWQQFTEKNNQMHEIAAAFTVGFKRWCGRVFLGHNKTEACPCSTSTVIQTCNSLPT